MGRIYRADLHIHTVLSPCGELEMDAPGIVGRARDEGIDIIAVTDHNASDNYRAVSDYADGNPVVLPGMEVQTGEDIHVLTIFADEDTVKKFQEIIRLKMMPMKNAPEVFGHQPIIDSKGDILEFEDLLLMQGTLYDIDSVVRMTQERGGIAILAHVDRPSFSYTAALGPFPEDYPADAFEISSAASGEAAAKWLGKYPLRTFTRSSDAHMIEHISRDRCTEMYLEAPSFDEIKLAIAGQDGRYIISPWRENLDG
ncbi:histidinol-phosphatase [Synergistales bacterium]|nr:histidinol-phosphatase [Synergistales bacterium]